MMEKPNFHSFEYPECGFSSIQKADFSGSELFPSGHDLRMRRWGWRARTTNQRGAMRVETPTTHDPLAHDPRRRG